jgi:hypothetical protein
VSELRDRSVVLGFASGAGGGDILFHEECRSRQIDTTMVLPFEPNQFVGCSVEEIPGGEMAKALLGSLAGYSASTPTRASAAIRRSLRRMQHGASWLVGTAACISSRFGTVEAATVGVARPILCRGSKQRIRPISLPRAIFKADALMPTLIFLKNSSPVPL